MQRQREENHPHAWVVVLLCHQPHANGALDAHKRGHQQDAIRIAACNRGKALIHVEAKQDGLDEPLWCIDPSLQK